MKVKFECEKCGFLFSEKTYDADWSAAYAKSTVREAVAAELVGQFVCPNCAKLTYGPLTEELVAEALHLAHKDTRCLEYGPTWQELSNKEFYVNEARFVLRLLENLYPYRDGRSYVPTNRFGDMDWRDWLLELARKP
jgi:hypothetical protein